MKYKMPAAFLPVAARATFAAGAELEDWFRHPPEETKAGC